MHRHAHSPLALNEMKTKLLLNLAALCLPGSILAAADTNTAKPNILFFLADDWGRNASCYRDPARPSVNDVIETPNIDRVARDGVLFRHAFMGVSSCAPSRASMASGCYFWRCGKTAFLQPDPGWEINNTPNPGEAFPSFGVLLQKAGYATSFSGKALKLDKRHLAAFSARRRLLCGSAFTRRRTVSDATRPPRFSSKPCVM